MNLQPDNIIKSTTEHLDTDDCLLSKLINISENVEIKNFFMILHRHEESIKFDLSDIFMQNHINVPSLDKNCFVRYNTTSTIDLKPFIISLSWKNPSLVITRENDILEFLSGIIKKMSKNQSEFYYYHDDNISKVLNLCSDINFGIKYEYEEDHNRLFVLFNDKIIFSNLNQMDLNMKNETLKRLNIIENALGEEDGQQSKVD